MMLQLQRIDSIIQYSFGLDEEIDRITQRAYHFKGFKGFCTELKDANESLRQIFLEELNYLKQNGVCLQFAKLNEAIDTWHHLRRLVNIIEDVKMENFPKETMRPFTQFIKQNNMHCEIFATDMDDMNFSFVEFWIGFNRRMNNLGIAGVSQNRRVLYKFPKFQRDNILLGTIMAHEFGHYLDISEYSTSQSVYIQLVNSTDFHMLHQYITGLTHVPNIDPQLIIQNILTTATRYNQDIVMNWARELFADVYGTLFYGPAFFFAQAELRLYDRYKPDTDSSNEYSDHFVVSHPPDTIRNKVILLTLQKIGVLTEIEGILLDKLNMYRQTFEVTIDRIKVLQSGELVSVWPGVSLHINNDFYKTLYNIFDKNLGNLVDEAMLKFPRQFIFTPDIWKLSMDPSLQQKIMNLVPPNEIGNSPVNLQAIVNCAWAAYYLHFDELVYKYFTALSEEERRFKVFQTLSSLIRKALDSAYIHLEWNERSRQP